MKFFDLTFNGTVLPEHDPSKVKLAFAQLFGIDDCAELEDAFSGKTIVLRHNLDRRTAAEYFRKIVELGGKAALVESVDPPAGDASDINASPDRTHSSRESMSAQSQKGGDPDQIKHLLARAALKDKAESQSKLTAYGDELDRLRTLTSQMKERSKQRYLALQSRKEAFQSIADQEWALIEQTSKDTLTSVRSELGSLRTQEEQLKQNAEAENSTLEQQQDRLKTLSREKFASLEGLKQEVKKREAVSIADIESRREATRLSAEQELMRLQQLILEAQRQAKIDDVRFVQDIQRANSSALLELEKLEQQKIEELSTLEQNTGSLIERQKAANLRLEADLAEHKRRQQELQLQSQEETSRLSIQRLAIMNTRDTGLAQVEKASKELEAVTRKNLKKLYAMELQAKRRHNEALQNYLDPGLHTFELPEITSL